MRNFILAICIVCTSATAWADTTKSTQTTEITDTTETEEKTPQVLGSFISGGVAPSAFGTAFATSFGFVSEIVGFSVSLGASFDSLESSGTTIADDYAFSLGVGISAGKQIGRLRPHGLLSFGFGAANSFGTSLTVVSVGAAPALSFAITDHFYTTLSLFGVSGFIGDDLSGVSFRIFDGLSVAYQF